MALINENFLKLPESYLFSDIKKKVEAFKHLHPDANIISLGIGDVTRPIAPVVIEALHAAVDEMGDSKTFRGYGPEQGYDFLQKKIIENDYIHRGVDLAPDEIFISDGAKSDIGNIGDILSMQNRVAVTDPVYPVYIDTNVMGGRAGNIAKDGQHWDNIIYIPCTSENNFIPEPPSVRPDIIYLCYPNNPTGTTLSKNELEKWVNYALENETLILFDSAYEAYIHDEGIPHSIYEVKDAKRVAIEFRSFSKTAGLQIYGGDNAPYIWVKTPNELSSWKFFDRLLYECHIVGTPGVGFGPSGEGYFRLTAFGRYEDTIESISRIQNWKL